MTCGNKVVNCRSNVSEVNFTESLFDILFGLFNVSLELRVGDGWALVLHLVLGRLGVDWLIGDKNPYSIIDLVDSTVHVVEPDFLADVATHSLCFVHVIEVTDSPLFLQTT